MAEIYKRFAIEYPQADFSDVAALAMYEHETHGKPLERTEKLNGFALGKKWMDVTIAGWKEEIASRGILVSELIEDGYPKNEAQEKCYSAYLRIKPPNAPRELPQDQNQK